MGSTGCQFLLHSYPKAAVIQQLLPTNKTYFATKTSNRYTEKKIFNLKLEKLLQSRCHCNFHITQVKAKYLFLLLSNRNNTIEKNNFNILYFLINYSWLTQLYVWKFNILVHMEIFTA